MDSKTFAIITDIHSNISSLEKALEIIYKRNDIDQIICLGDCFALGPEPEATLKRLNSIPDCIFVRGNHDRYLIEGCGRMNYLPWKAWTPMILFVKQLSKMKSGLLIC